MDKAGASGIFAESPTLGEQETPKAIRTTLRDAVRWSQSMIAPNELADSAVAFHAITSEQIDLAIEGLDACKALLLEIRNRERV